MREKETWVCEWRSLELGTPGVVLIMALIVALTLAFLLASHVGAWYAVAAHVAL